MPTATFTFTGSAQSFTVPAGVTTLTLDLRGAASASAGAFGARVVCDLAVTPGETLGVYVGGNNGYNGGGAAGSGDFPGIPGGGASDVRQGGSTLADRVAVAAGGGGGGGGTIGAGGANGADGSGFKAGHGATTSAGGAGGPGQRGGAAGSNGTLGQGGAGGAPGSTSPTWGGCGGGGGYYGGGGGGGDATGSGSNGDGGGGSSIGTGVAQTITDAFNSVGGGDSEIIITWTAPPSGMAMIDEIG